jgi:hypothetical protein
MRNVAVSVVISLALCAGAVAQSAYTSVIGTVEKIDAGGKAITVKPDKGDASATVKYDDRTSFEVIPAGETDMKKATPAKGTDLAEGDKVLARVLSADPGKPARTVYITKQADLAKRRERTQEEWKTATNGIITSVDPSVIKINARVPGSPTPKEISIEVGPKVDYQRYNPETGAYEASNFAAIKVGDQLRVLGEKNTDLTQIKAESIGTGSFKTVGILVKSIDPAAKQIIGTETASKKPIVVGLRGDTTLKKFSDMAAMMVARQLNPTYQGAAGRGMRGGGAPGGGTPPASASAEGAPGGGGRGPGGEGASAGGGRGFGGGRGRGGMDVGRIIEQQPAIQLADLKPGDAIIVTGATAADASKLIANALVAGVEPILRAAPNNGADPLAGSWNMGGGAGGEQ